MTNEERIRAVLSPYYPGLTQTAIDDITRELMSYEGRPGWDEYFLGIARAVAARGECVRSRVGAVLVRDNRIVATGYNGVAAGEPSCLDGACPRGISNVARRSEGGPGYDVAPCIATHAEGNAIDDAVRRGLISLTDNLPTWTMYLTKEPCADCADLLRSFDLQVVWWDETRQMGSSEKTSSK